MSAVAQFPGNVPTEGFRVTGSASCGPRVFHRKGCADLDRWTDRRSAPATVDELAKGIPCRHCIPDAWVGLAEGRPLVRTGWSPLRLGKSRS